MNTNLIIKVLQLICILVTSMLFLGAATALSQAESFCPPGQQPHFSHGFAFLKSQLGQSMGEPLECERYDSAGNASQRTTTGQAFYYKDTNTPIFTAGNLHWAWTSSGLRQWVDDLGAGEPAAQKPATQPSPAITGGQPLTTPAIRVMSYNVLYGAGANPDWERAAAQLSPFAYPGNRLPQILDVIKAADPDILAVQEAAGWDSGSPAIAQQVAAELGLNYYLAPTKNGLNLALFTRFKIVTAENLSARMGNVGALRATLSMPDEQLIHVFAVHLDPFAASTRAGELAILTQEMLPYLHGSTVLLGDMNYFCLDDPEHCREYQVLDQAGWQLALAGKYKIDQIWTSPRLNRPVEAITFPGASFAISDHLPIGAVIKIPPS